MARYLGPKSKVARRFGEAIFGPDKVLSRRNFPPGQHGNNRRRKMSEYAVMLAEKQKAKYTYGVLERQFRNLFEKAAKADGITGEVLLQLLESRLDNVVFRLGIAPTRAAARQLVGHKHITVDGKVSGNCHLMMNGKMKIRHRANVAIALLKEYWGLGIGTKMFEAMLDAARANPDLMQVELEVVEGNDRAMALYKKMGFEVYGVRPNAIKLKDGTLLSETLMVNKLR